MKQDKQKTKVLFLIDKCGYTNEDDNVKGETFAFFPKEHYHYKGHPDYKRIFYCYAHIGQHSACHNDYAKQCDKATPEQYKDLKQELESIGYNLEILN